MNDRFKNFEILSSKHFRYITSASGPVELVGKNACKTFKENYSSFSVIQQTLTIFYHCLWSSLVLVHNFDFWQAHCTSSYMYVHSHFVVLTCICTHTHYYYHFLHSFILCYCSVLFCIHVCIYIILHYGHLAPLYYHLLCSIIIHPLNPSTKSIGILYCTQHAHCTLTSFNFH